MTVARIQELLDRRRRSLHAKTDFGIFDPVTLTIVFTVTKLRQLV